MKGIRIRAENSEAQRTRVNRMGKLVLSLRKQGSPTLQPGLYYKQSTGSGPAVRRESKCRLVRGILTVSSQVSNARKDTGF